MTRRSSLVLLLAVTLLATAAVAGSAQAQTFSPDNTGVHGLSTNSSLTYGVSFWTCDRATMDGNTGLDSDRIGDLALTFTDNCAVAGVGPLTVDCVGEVSLIADPAADDFGTVELNEGFQCAFVTSTCTISVAGPQTTQPQNTFLDEANQVLSVDLEWEATRTGSMMCGPASGTLSFSADYAVTNDSGPHVTIDPSDGEPPDLEAAGYDSGAGQAPIFSFETDRVTDRAQLMVNLGSGNLHYAQNDLSIEGTGLPLVVDRFYNSLGGGSGMFGQRWHAGVGQDVKVTELSGGDVEFQAPSFFKGVFRKRADGTFRAPLGLRASLEREGDGVWAITYDKSDVKLRFAGPGNTLSAIRDPHDNELDFDFDGSGRMHRVTDTQDRVTTLDYEAGGRVKEVKDSTGRAAAYSYDGAGDLVQMTDLNGKTTRYAYNGAHNLTQITDPRGNPITMTYDGTGRVRSVDHAGSVTRFAYDTGSSVCSDLADTKSTTVTDPNGHDTVYCVDSEFRVVRTKRPLMDAVTSTFDADSNEEVVGSEGALTLREFDVRNRLTSQTSPMGVSASFLYEDSQHPFRPTKYTNPQDKSLRFDYEDHNLVSITDDLGFEQRFTYNDDGTMATSRDQRHNVTSYSYDAKGNRTGVDYPGPLGDESFTYDALSRIRTMTDGKGQTRTFDYDPLDRIVKVTFSDGSSVSYTYDENGNRITRSDHTGSTDFLFYDELNRLEQEKLPEPRTIDYTYDLAGNLKTFSDGGGVVSYDYNAADQLTALTEPGGHRTTFAYDNRGNRTEVAFPNSVTIKTPHDLSNRVEKVEATKPGSPALVSLLDDYTSGNRERALRQRVTDLRQGTTTSYSYDHLDRLTSAQSPGENWSYSYDPTSNRTQEIESVSGISRSYGYNAANQLTSRAGASYSYDLNGNTLTEQGGNSFSYNPKDHTTQISGEAFKYAGVTQFELTHQGGTTYTNTLLGISRKGADHFTRDPKGVLLGQRTPSHRYYPIADSLGSIVAVTDKDGNLVGRHDYEPFGAEQGSPAFNSPFRFAGELYHPGHKLYKIGARWYDPKLGRWTQPDLVDQPRDPRQANRYQYAGQDPVNLVDPLGLRSLAERAAGFAAGTISGGFTAAVTIAGAPIVASACASDDTACLKAVGFYTGVVSAGGIATYQSYDYAFGEDDPPPIQLDVSPCGNLGSHCIG